MVDHTIGSAPKLNEWTAPPRRVRNGWENLSFENALNAEKERRAANWAWG